MTAPHTPTVAIIGAGFGGLGMAIGLKKAGYTDVTIFERAAGVGGVWRDNAYPGAACDVPSHLYSYSFEPNTDWSRRFARQPEILEYLDHCADKYDVRRQIRFGTEVVSAAFDEVTAQWTLELADGSTHTAHVLVPACGQLSRPAYPKIPGLDMFGGEVFHSARWRSDVDLTDRDVAVIGTGASAIQIVPEIAPRAGRLRLFQRGAAHVIRKPDHAYPQRLRSAFAAIPGLQRASRWATYWQLETRALAFTRAPQLMKTVEARFRMHLRRGVRDPELRRRLLPDSPIGCKRILISNDYYPALARPDVDLVTDAITEVDEHGIVTADGTHHPAQVIVLSTGFTATDFLTPMRVAGRGGRDLNDAWREGAEAHLGITVAGFPNFFLLYGPNTNLGHSSIVFMLESQIRYTIQALDRLRHGDIRWLDVRPDAQRASVEKVQAHITRSVWNQGCMNWYRTASGRNTNNWPGFTFSYRRQTRKVRWDEFHLEPADRNGAEHAAAMDTNGTGRRRTPFRRPGAPEPLVRAVVRGLQLSVFRGSLPWPVQRRRLNAAATASLATAPRGVRVRSDVLGGTTVTRVTASDRTADGPTVLHLHGGGFCVGSPTQLRGWAARLAVAIGGEVVLPHYPLAPEHPFPAAPDAVDRIWEALVAEAPASVALAGDSAGGNLALGLAQRLRDGQGRTPDALLLIAPWLDLAHDRAQNTDLVARDPMLTPGWLEACAAAYADGRELGDPRLSPLNGSPAGLPPTLVLTGSDDVLLPDSHRLVDGIRAAAGDARLEVADGMWHVYVIHAGLLKSADQAAEKASTFLVERSGAHRTEVEDVTHG